MPTEYLRLSPKLSALRMPCSGCEAVRLSMSIFTLQSVWRLSVAVLHSLSSTRVDFSKDLQQEAANHRDWYAGVCPTYHVTCLALLHSERYHGPFGHGNTFVWPITSFLLADPTTTAYFKECIDAVCPKRWAAQYMINR